MVRSQRSATRNKTPADAALVTAANKLMRTAYAAESGSRPKVCARMTNSGLPGGWGMPSTFAAAMYSEVSQNAVVGARVARYIMKTTEAVRTAHQYGGVSWFGVFCSGSVLAIRSRFWPFTLTSGLTFLFSPLHSHFSPLPSCLSPSV